MNYTKMIPPKVKDVDLSHIQIEEDGTTSIDFGTLLNKPEWKEIREQMEAIDNARQMQAANKE